LNEGEEGEYLRMSDQLSFLTRSQKLLGGFLFDRLELDGSRPPRRPASATDSGDGDHEDIEEYVKSLKRKAQESRRVGGSSTDKSLIPHRPELWMLPVPVRSFHIYQ
jgi:hypothetical protein